MTDEFSISIRPPRAEDAGEVWRLVAQTPTLDANSAYTYLLLCTDFAETGAVAESDGRVVGFVLGYRPPSRPDTYFVWQVGVAPEQQGRGLGRTLLDCVLEAALPRGVRYLEATVTPSNGASWSLFRGVAERSGAAYEESPGFASQLFPDADHEEEVRLRIGPLEHHALHSLQL